MDWKWLIAPGSFFVIAPLTLLVGLVMLWQPANRRHVLPWWALFAGACLLTAASKVSHYAWGTQISRWDLTCFSGHSMLAFAFWPLVLPLLTPARRRPVRALLLLAGLALALLIAVSRVKLGAHPVSEVIAGSVLGLLVSTLAGCRLSRTHLPWPAGLLLAIVLAGLLHVESRQAALTRSCTEPLFAWIGAHLDGRPPPPVPCLRTGSG